MPIVDRSCSIEGCSRRRHANGMCSPHYKRWKRRGTTDDLTMTTEQRFFSHVEQVGDCWLWTAFKQPAGGYGKFFLQNRCLLAHRWSYEFLRGEIPTGLHLDHLCRVTACVNPWHLEPVSARVNVVDRGRGTSSTNARKTECLRGHPFDTANTYIDKRGRRNCRQCRDIHSERRASAST